MARLAKFIAPTLTMTPPDVGSLNPADLRKLYALNRQVKTLTEEELYTFARLMTMSAADYLDEWFERDALKAGMCSSGIIGTLLGPRSPGTAYVLMHHYMGEIDGAYRSWGYVRGGMGMVSESIARAARSFGADIRVNADVRRILVKDGRAVGVELATGERIEAKVIASGADPKRTLLKFLERSDLPADFIRGIERFMIEGSSGKANFALKEAPSFSALPGNGPQLQGAISIGPTVDYIEKAYDDAKYGDFSHRPFIDMCVPSTLDPTLAPPGKHIMSCFIQYAPYTLRKGTWPERREDFAETVIDTIEEYIPNLRDIILHRQVLSPWALEHMIGLTGADICGLLRPEIVDDLNLPDRGLRLLALDPEVTAVGDHTSLRIWRDVWRTQAELITKSSRDAEAYPRFTAFLRDFATALDPLVTMTPPNVAAPTLGEQMGLLRRALAVRRLGKDTMQQMLRMPPMSVRDFLNEWFETDLLKASFAVDALVGTFQGPFSPGTAFGLVPHFLPAVQGGGWSFVKGGMGTLASALALAAREAGATIRTNADVRRITSTDGRVTGVELSDGERIAGRAVASNADPKRTFLHLIDPEELDPEFLVHVRNFEMNGVVAKVNFALDRAPGFPGASDAVPAHFRICPSLEYLERAYDDAKYGSVSVAPFLDVFVPTVIDPDLAPTGKHVVSTLVQYAPYDLRPGNWEAEGDRLGDKVVGLLEEQMPGFEKLVVARQVLTPRELESRFGLTEGHIYHGEMTLDQSLVLRPVPGWSRYRTPVEGLYLCGSGAHPGGGVTGAPGYNAAREILADWNRISS